MSAYKFFCRHPKDWFEGANMGHLMSLAFEEEVDEDAERLIAKHIHETNLSFEKLLFSGRVMKFFTGGTGRVFLEKVEAFADKLHHDVPITDIVFHGLRDGEVGYDHPPVAAADMNFGLGIPRPIDADAPPWHGGTVIGAELQRLYETESEDEYVRAARKALDKALAKQADAKQTGVHVERTEPPEMPAQDLSLFRPKGEPNGYLPGDGDIPWPHPGRPMARSFRGDSAFSTALAVIEGGERVEVEVGLPLLQLSASPDENYVLFASQVFLGRIDFATGKVTPLPTPNAHEGLISVAALANGSWAALTRLALYIFDEANTLIAIKKTKGTGLTVFADGYGIGVWKRSQFTAFCFVHGKLKSLHKFGYAPPPAKEIGDALYFTTRVGHLALVGAMARIAEERAKKPRKPKAKTLECEVLSWSHAPDAVAPEKKVVDLPDSITAAQASSSPSGEWLALQNPGALSVHHRPTSSTTPALPDCSDFFMNDDGRLIALGFGQVMWRHKPEGPAREWPGLRYSLSLRKGRASYLHDHDLLFVFFENGNAPAAFACAEIIYPLMPLPGLLDAFEREGKAYLQMARVTIQVEGLKELARDFPR